MSCLVCGGTALPAMAGPGQVNSVELKIYDRLYGAGLVVTPRYAVRGYRDDFFARHAVWVCQAHLIGRGSAGVLPTYPAKRPGGPSCPDCPRCPNTCSLSPRRAYRVSPARGPGAATGHPAP